MTDKKPRGGKSRFNLFPFGLALFILFVVFYFSPNLRPPGGENPSPLLRPVSPNAPLPEKEKKKNDLEEAAKEAPYLEIGNCQPSPVILKVVNKEHLIVKNSGGSDISLRFSGHRYKVPARGTITMSLDFAKDELHPWYWYTCGKPYTSGIIWVVYTYYKNPTFL